MAEIIRMPRLSDTMTEGTVATWAKKIGDKISEGDILAEIETDKATMEFESFYSGTLLYIGVAEGDTAPVDTILAIIGAEGTDVSALIKESDSPNASPAKTEEKPSPESKKEENTKHDNPRIFASPLAKKMAEEKGIDLSQIKGSGENERIVKSDIENYISTGSTQKSSNLGVTHSNIAPTGSVQVEEISNSQMRKTIARRLSESKFSAPHYYLTIELDMENMIEARKNINAQPDTKISFNDIIVKASAMALKKHPQVNSSWTDASILINKHINIGVAVAVEDGLVVPVVNHTDLMSLSQISENIKDLATKAKNKKLQPNEMEGSTFTISNLGMFGIEEFTSIINQPNSAILSVGAIIEKPVVKNGQIVVGNTMKVTLACDHRSVDGATGAAFLQTLKTYIENPITMLI